MGNILIIGGGFAGLSAACYLAEQGFKIRLLEASPKLGGRAYSFEYLPKNDIIDNGQHIMLGCYRNTLEFLNLIGASDKIDIQKNMSVNFVKRGGMYFKLSADGGFYPISLVFGLAKFGAIRIRERIRILSLFINMLFESKENLKYLTVKEWLLKNGQNETTIKALWDILAVSTLNTSIENASAKLFRRILQEIFLKNSKGANIVIPKKGLSDIYCTQAEDFIKKRDGSIHLSEKVNSFCMKNRTVNSIITDKNEYSGFDYVISAVPHYALEKFHPGIKSEQPDLNLEYSTVLTVHIWLNSNPFTEKFYGLIDSEIHWLFNHGKHITLVISNADKFNKVSENELIALIYSELEEYFPIFYSNLVEEYKIIKEKRATFIPSIESENNRSKLSQVYGNIILAGDWTNTKLPSTIEGAVLSGKNAAEKIISLC